MRADPGGEGREAGEVVVHRRRRQVLVLEVLLPGHDVALETRTCAVVAVGVPVEGEEAAELQGELPGDFLGALAGDGELLVALGLDGETVHGRRRGIRDKGNRPVFTFVK